MVYSHDTFGLGNFRRMLAICEHLLTVHLDWTILMVTGSPMVQSFRLPARLDYIKLPCLSRVEREGYAVRSMQMPIDRTIQLRANLIEAAVADFRPDLLLVDKKPYGVKNELRPALECMSWLLPQSKKALVLRDILDSPESTIATWEKCQYHKAIASFYDLVLVVGSPEVFDLPQEYCFPEAVSRKVRFCGYIHRPVPPQERHGHNPEPTSSMRKRVLVTSGGGEDGYHLLATYLKGLQELSDSPNVDSLLVCGPEMPESHRAALHKMAGQSPNVHIREFTDDMLGAMQAADVVVSMGGYNTMCEVVSLQKKAIVVPRVRPVAEQWIRAERLARLGMVRAIHPDVLTPHGLMRAVTEMITAPEHAARCGTKLDFDALPRIAQYTATLLHGEMDVDTDDLLSARGVQTEFALPGTTSQRPPSRLPGRAVGALVQKGLHQSRRVYAGLFS